MPGTSISCTYMCVWYQHMKNAWWNKEIGMNVGKKERKKVEKKKQKWWLFYVCVSLGYIYRFLRPGAYKYGRASFSHLPRDAYVFGSYTRDARCTTNHWIKYILLVCVYAWWVWESSYPCARTNNIFFPLSRREVYIRIQFMKRDGQKPQYI